MKSSKTPLADVFGAFHLQRSTAALNPTTSESSKAAALISSDHKNNNLRLHVSDYKTRADTDEVY